jgi:alpha-acetolactate decarboxylase
VSELISLGRVWSALCSLVAFAGCSAPQGGWDFSVGRWGTLREALREGRSEARVVVGDVVGSPHALGVGAVAGLQGEITVLDGVVWVSRGDASGSVVSERGDGRGVEATLLALARVDRWRSEPLASSSDRAALEADVQRALEHVGLGKLPCVPFVVRGELTGLRGHILRGACPNSPAEPPPGAQPALELDLPRARGTLVGFWTSLPPGELAHHGEHAHIHVLFENGTTAHVDGVGAGASAVLALPDLSR